MDLVKITLDRDSTTIFNEVNNNFSSIQEALAEGKIKIEIKNGELYFTYEI